MSTSKTRDRLLEVARELFAHQGLEATTMNDIAARSVLEYLAGTLEEKYIVR